MRLDRTECINSKAIARKSEGTDKTTAHSYGHLYDSIFEDLVGKDNVNVLEIGVFGGSFIKVMSDYLP